MDLRRFPADECIYNADEIKRVKYVYDHGHQIGSHTWSHPDLTQLSWDQSTHISFHIHTQADKGTRSS